ncbi:hypothetical protein C8A01DRAFT_32323 [Parachaetomium inaequale]|uniref:Uncharacterized protein n=1 Tax=Parachaetomium inaequale TaxID=2588326 RepID=A0AAN6PM45_9PEZI|nr:hypothetical protein C8A01DRAFT_32323 [Parachaetomium inaequale]
MAKNKFINTAKRTGTTSPVDSPTPATTTSPAVAPKGTDNGGKPFQVKWNEESHTALLGILVNIVTDNGAASINKHKDQIMAGLEAHGFGFSWDAIR